MNKSRLFVFQLKEIIYTLIFIVLGIILIIVLINMFKGNKTTISTNGTKLEQNNCIAYMPGVYTTQLNLNDQTLNIKLTVDNSTIKSITLTNLNNNTSIMYPLLEPSIEYIESELSKGTPISKIEFDTNSKYTQSLLVDAISNLLNEATIAK